MLYRCGGVTPSIPDAPDLSQTLTASDFEDIATIVKAGKAAEKFNLGDELKVTYGDDVMPFEIVGFEDVEVQGGETVPAINLLAKYTGYPTSNWGNDVTEDTDYGLSALRSCINGVNYKDKLDSNFVACLSDTLVKTYNRNGNTSITINKLFAPSMAQLGVTDNDYNTTAQAEVEGPAFAAYAGASDSKRIRNAITGTSVPQYYWTRSLYLGSSGRFGCISTVGTPQAANYSGNFLVVAACNFTG